MSVAPSKVIARPANPGLPWKIIAPIGIALLAIVGFVGYRQFGAPVPASAGTYFTVVPTTLDLKVAKDGDLQSIDNIDITCKVEGQTTITWVVKEGASVKKGETVLTLDSSQIKQKLEDATLDLQTAESALTAAKEQLEIQKGANASYLQGAEVELTLAQLDLQQYTQGVYPQLEDEARRAVDMAKISLTNKQEDLKQTQSLFGKGFVTAADVKQSELDVLTAQNDLTKKTTDLKVLTAYTHQKDLASKKNALAQSEQKLERIKAENSSNLSQKSADASAKTQSLVLRRRRTERLADQVAACTIAAPADGMVVYSSSFDRSQQTPIQEGTQVRERQLLLRLPDVTKMKAVIRVQEAQVPKLRMGQRATVKIVGVPKPVGAQLSWISVLADNSQRWWNPDLREYPVDLDLDQTPADLKPGMGVQAEILIERINDALAVPLACVYSVGNTTYVFVHEGDRDVPREVTLGATNETHARIVKGVSEEDSLRVLQIGEGRQLLDDAGIKIAPATRPAVGRRAKPPTPPPAP